MSGFGLILKKKSSASSSITSSLDNLIANSIAKKRNAVFNDEDDDAVVEKKTASSFSNSSILKRKAEMEHAKALAEDPTVFEYDTIHDEIVAKRTEKMEDQKKLDKERKPKYVPALMRAAKRREIEHESREERKQKLERDQEGKEFEDKEVFVTGAYRKRMEEVHAFQIEEDRKDEIMGRMDVTKQNDLSGFHRHLLNDVLARGPSNLPKIKTEVEENVEENEEEKKSEKDSEKIKTNKSKEYRKRRRSASPESEEEKPKIKKSSQGSIKKHTIYSSSSEDETPRAPTPPFKGGLQILKKKPESVKEIKTKTHDKKHKKRSKSERSSSEEETTEKIAPQEKEKTPPPKKLDVMADVSVFGKPEITTEQRLKQLKIIFKTQHTEESIAEYRRKYFERKAEGFIVPPV